MCCAELVVSVIQASGCCSGASPCAPEQGFEEAVVERSLCVRGSGVQLQRTRTLGCSEGQQHFGCGASKTAVKFQAPREGPQAHVPLQHLKCGIQFEKENGKEMFLDLSNLGW